MQFVKDLVENIFATRMYAEKIVLLFLICSQKNPRLKFKKEIITKYTKFIQLRKYFNRLSRMYDLSVDFE